jgi:hypothetical protein
MARELSPKARHFARLLLEGKSQQEAYREAYDADGYTDKSVNEKASRLRADPRVSRIVEDGMRDLEIESKRRFMTDAELVAGKLREVVENMDTGRPMNTQIKACELLGKTAGMFTDILEVRDTREASEIRQELEEKLRAILGSQGTTEDRPSVH